MYNRIQFNHTVLFILGPRAEEHQPTDNLVVMVDQTIGEKQFPGDHGWKELLRAERFGEVLLSDIVLGPDFRMPNQEREDELLEDIRLRGLLNPIIIQEGNVLNPFFPKYQVLAGNRRFAAVSVIQNGMGKIKCRIWRYFPVIETQYVIAQ